MKWYEQLTDDYREGLFAYMRYLRELCDYHNAQVKWLMPPGTIPAGSVWFDEFIKTVAIDGFLSAISNGSDLSQALLLAKYDMMLATEKHNSRHEFQQQRYIQTAFPFIENEVKILAEQLNFKLCIVQLSETVVRHTKQIKLDPKEEALRRYKELQKQLAELEQ